MTLKTVPANGTITINHPEINGVTQVGSGAVLADSDTGTYIDGNPVGIDYQVALPALDSYDATDPIYLHLRMSIESDGHTGVDGEAFIFLQDGHAGDTTGDYYIGEFSNTYNLAWSIPGPYDGTIRDFVLPFTPKSPFTVTGALQTLAAGTALLSFNSLSIFDAGLLSVRVYEAWLEVGAVSPCYQALTPSFVAAESQPDVVVVGDADTVWHDGSDSTYTTLTGSGIYARGSLGTYEGRAVTDLGFTVRLSATGSPAELANVILYADGIGNIAATADMPVAADGGVAEYSHTFTADELYVPLESVRDMLATGAGRLEFDINGAGDAAVNIYEASVRVGHKCVVNIPQLRKYPNPNIGPTRQWPRPRRGITGIR